MSPVIVRVWVLFSHDKDRVQNVVVPEQAGNSDFKTYGRRKEKDAANEKTCNLYSSPIARTFKMKVVRRVWHVTRML
jgi:hypothetical protein